MEENMERTDDFKKGWLAGIFDGEGTIFFRGAGRKYRSAYTRISVGNTDKAIIEKCCEYLTYLHIDFFLYTQKPRKQNWKEATVIIIGSQKGVLNFSKYVGFLCPHKAKKLSDAIKWITRPRTKYNLEELKKWHWEEGLSYRKIADRLGLKGRSSIKTLFDRWNIPHRDRLSGLKNHYS
jgi:hypothetical protein